MLANRRDDFLIIHSLGWYTDGRLEPPAQPQYQTSSDDICFDGAERES